MPIYEYQCNTCHHTLELLCKHDSAPVASCPMCQSSDLSRIVSATSFQLKGAGWYVSDYAKNKRNNAPDLTNTAAATAPDASTTTTAGS